MRIVASWMVHMFNIPEDSYSVTGSTGSICRSVVVASVQWSKGHWSNQWTLCPWAAPSTWTCMTIKCRTVRSFSSVNGSENEGICQLSIVFCLTRQTVFTWDQKSSLNPYKSIRCYHKLTKVALMRKHCSTLLDFSRLYRITKIRSISMEMIVIWAKYLPHWNGAVKELTNMSSFWWEIWRYYLPPISPLIPCLLYRWKILPAVQTGHLGCDGHTVMGWVGGEKNDRRGQTGSVVTCRVLTFSA